ncbi:iron ABC transporter permease [Rhodovarius crocodyli]|uniref:Iron ABC transporter permease n=2 Tax=Rhodovarius crocodyli TaxID=1979269 RepID=A0A437M3T7_9PROT|nr:iron ABC transporter permease [Rhodovarius crocodyli]
MPRRLSLAMALGLLVLGTGLVFMLTMAVGAVRIPPATLLAALLDPAAETLEAGIVWNLRLPRTLLAGLVGAVLGLSGAVMQGLFRNPLADPGLLGVSAGGALGAVGMIVVGLALIPSPLRPYAVAGAAFLAALAATVVVLRLATVGGRVHVASMLLAGIVMNAFAAAGTSAFVFAASDMQLRDVMFWTMGSFSGASWGRLGAAVVAALPLLAAAPFLARGLDALILGEREALTLGIGLEAMKRLAVLMVALAVGGAVAAAGMIGFVGIIAPHLVRLAGGSRHRWVLPAAALTGAMLMMAADAFARVAVSPAELPIGLVSALLGAPMFLWLLLRQRAALEGA